MNKRVLWAVVFALFLKVPAQAAPTKSHHEDTSILMDYEEFSQLTHGEQLTYVKKLREMALAIEQRDPGGAALLLRKSPFFAQLVNMNLSEAEAQTAPAAPSTAAAAANPDQTTEERFDYAMDQSKKYQDSLRAVTKKKVLTPEEQAGLQEGYKNYLFWLGSAAVKANAIQNTELQAKMKQEVEAARASSTKLEAAVIRNMPTTDQANAKTAFTQMKKDYVDPSIKGTFKAADSLPSSVRGAKPFAATPPAAGQDGKTTEVTASVGGKAIDAAKGTGVNAGIKLPVPVAGAPGAPSLAPAPAPLGSDGKPTDVAKNAKSNTAEEQPDPRSHGRREKQAALAKLLGIKPEVYHVQPAKNPNGKPLLAPAEPKKTTETTSSETGKKADKPGDKPADKDNAKKETADPAAEKELFRCMYAGLVIRGASCVGPATSPYELKGIDMKAFACSGGTVLCNPLIFGVKSEGCDWATAAEKKALDGCFKNAKPVCVSPSVDATKDCQEQTNSNAAIESAVEMFHSNHAAYTQFKKDFDGLCEAENIGYDLGYAEGKHRSKRSREWVKNDVERTCKIARKTMSGMLKRFKEKYPDQILPVKSPDAPGAKTDAHGAKPDAPAAKKDKAGSKTNSATAPAAPSTGNRPPPPPAPSVGGPAIK